MPMVAPCASVQTQELCRIAFIANAAPCRECAVKWKDSVKKEAGGKLYIGGWLLLHLS